MSSNWMRGQWSAPRRESVNYCLFFVTTLPVDTQRGTLCVSRRLEADFPQHALHLFIGRDQVHVWLEQLCAWLTERQICRSESSVIVRPE